MKITLTAKEQEQVQVYLNAVEILASIKAKVGPAIVHVSQFFSLKEGGELAETDATIEVTHVRAA